MCSLILLSLLTGSGTVIQINIDTTDPNIFTNSSYSVTQFGLNFSINESLAWISLLIVIVTIASVVGIQVFGSGLSDSSVHTITIVSFYVGFWLILTVFAYSLLESIQVFGLLIYFFLTLLYLYGISQKFST